MAALLNGAWSSLAEAKRGLKDKLLNPEVDPPPSDPLLYLEDASRLNVSGVPDQPKARPPAPEARKILRLLVKSKELLPRRCKGVFENQLHRIAFGANTSTSTPEA